MNSFHILLSRLQSITILIYFDAQVASFWARESPCKLLSTRPPFYFFTFWNKTFRVYLILSLSQPWNQPFLKGALIQFRGGYLEQKIWVVSVFIAIEYHSSKYPSGYVCVHMCALACMCVYTHIHISIHFYIFSIY